MLQPVAITAGLAIVITLAVPAVVGSTSHDEATAFERAMERADLLMLEGDFKGAIRAFQEARRWSQGTSFDCQLGLATAYNRIGAIKNAKQSARLAVDLAETPIAEAAAENQLGKAYFDGGNAAPQDLMSAAECFRRVLELAPSEGNLARFSLGVTLLKLGQDDEGVVFLEQFLATDPEGREASIARSYLDNPLRATVPLIPDFQFVTLDGEYLTSDDLLGKVVLIDFWGTWCAPCVAAIPSLRRLSRKANKYPFVLLSISHQDEETELEQFIAEHEMTWPQTRDEDRELVRAFDVQSFPTYILVDPTGKIVYRHSGWSERIAVELNSRVSKQLRLAKRLEQKE